MKTKTILITFIGLLAITTLVFQGCKKENTTTNQSVPETTKVIDEQTWQTNLNTMDSTDFTLYFDEGINGEISIKAGDYLVSSNGNGLLRKIKNVTINNGEVIVETEFASLTDVVSEGQTSFSSVLSLQKVGRINFLKEGMVLDTTMLKSSENTPLEYDIDVFLDPQQKIHIQGHFSLLTDLNGEIEIKFIPPRISYFELTYNIDQNLDLAADVELMDNNYNKEIGLANITFQPIIAILSGVPVVLVPELEIVAGIESSVDCHVYSSLTQHMDYTMGIVYEDRQWNTINELNKSFDFMPPQLSCNAAAKAYIKPQFNILIYDVVSPYLYADLYGNIEADLQSTPWWNLYAGADIGIGIKAAILGLEIFDFSTNPPLIHFEQLIASATSNNTPPIAIFSVSPASGTTSTNFAFDASGCSDNETPTNQLQVRWDFDGNGNWDTNWETEKITSHQYSNDGSYSVVMEVKDGNGLTDQFTELITVINGGGTNGFFDLGSVINYLPDNETYQSISLNCIPLANKKYFIAYREAENYPIVYQKYIILNDDLSVLSGPNDLIQNDNHITLDNYAFKGDELYFACLNVTSGKDGLKFGKFDKGSNSTVYLGNKTWFPTNAFSDDEIIKLFKSANGSFYIANSWRPNGWNVDKEDVYMSVSNDNMSSWSNWIYGGHILGDGIVRCNTALEYNNEILLCLQTTWGGSDKVVFVKFNMNTNSFSDFIPVVTGTSASMFMHGNNLTISYINNSGIASAKYSTTNSWDNWSTEQQIGQTLTNVIDLYGSENITSMDNPVRYLLLLTTSDEQFVFEWDGYTTWTNLGLSQKTILDADYNGGKIGVGSDNEPIIIKCYRGNDNKYHTHIAYF